LLAAGSADGSIHIIQRKGDDSWTQQSFLAHDGGVNAVSWGPATEPAMLSHEHISSQVAAPEGGASFTLPPRRFVSAGCDGKIKFWYASNKDGGKFGLTKEILAHEDWVRDVAWCPNLGLSQDLVASCSEDQRVKLWKRTAT
jgi:protein transport protein SEC13